MRRFLVLTVATVLLVAACGDDDTGNNDDELVSGLTEQILSDSGTDDIAFDEADAACFAVGLIDEFGGERMVAAMDQEFEEFMAAASGAERRQVVDLMLECVDFGAMLTAEFATGLSAESSECLSTAFVGSEAFRDALADSMSGSATDPFDDQAVMEDLLPIMFECVSAEELIQLSELGEG